MTLVLLAVLVSLLVVGVTLLPVESLVGAVLGSIVPLVPVVSLLVVDVVVTTSLEMVPESGVFTVV